MFFDDGERGVGYVHKSEVTSLAFVNGEDAPNYLPIGMSFEFLVKRKRTDYQLFELSRKRLFQETARSLQYGATYLGRIVAVTTDKTILQGENFEGRLATFEGSHALGTEIEVIVARRGDDPRSVEFDYSR